MDNYFSMSRYNTYIASSSNLFSYIFSIFYFSLYKKHGYIEWKNYIDFLLINLQENIHNCSIRLRTHNHSFKYMSTYKGMASNV